MNNIPMWVLAGLLATSCGGGSGGSSGINDQGFPGDIPTQSPVEELPNLSITSFVAPNSFMIGSYEFSFTVSIANTGVAEVEIPGGWLLESTADDFSTGFIRTKHELVKRGGDGSNSLQPGEEAVFDARVPQGLNLRRNEVHYVKFWLNPDTGTMFETPEQRVMEHRELQEEIYTDNETETRAVSIEVPSLNWSCEDEALEDNDTRESAPLISMNESYPIINCLDEMDILAIELEEGQSYEITSTGSVGWPNISTMTLVAPDGSYLVQEAGINSVVTAKESGLHHIVVVVHSNIQDEGTVAINRL